jgi:hypothetical protein
MMVCHRWLFFELFVVAPPVDLRTRHVAAPLTVSNAFDTSLRCGLVFKVGQQHFTLRPSTEAGQQAFGPNDYSHALVRGISTCN